MPALSDVKTSENIKLLQFGDSGTGKTVFATTFPTPIHVLDFDNKISSAAAFWREKDPARLEQITFENYGPTDARGTQAERCSNDLGKMRKEGKLPRTLVLDSLTTFSDEFMRYLMRINPGIKRMDTKGAAVPAQQDYQVARLYFKQFIGELLVLPCNVVILAHIQVDKDEQTGEILRTPMIAGKLARELPIWFEEVHRSYVKAGKYMSQTQTDARYQCRTQIPKLPAEIELKYEELVKQR